MYKKYTNKGGMPKGYLYQILLIMRFTTIILIMAIMQVSASTFAQRITLSEKNATLRKVFDRISDQCGYDFVYNSDLLRGTKLVTISVKNTELDKVLMRIFANQPVSFSIEDKTVVVRLKEKGFFENVIARFQAIDVHGKILDENGEPLVGASITIKDSNRKTVTNEIGDFLFANVDEKAVLVVSYVGYDSQEVGVRKEMGNIQLKPAIGKLKEVTIVNTGYQTLPKERSTGSFSTVSKELFNQQVGTNILSRLPAIANAMVMDNSRQGSPQMMIRGLSTISGPKDPLIVVDNFPYDGNINNINPNMVESITILKDASASSIWGARAANGVIVITTKTGRYNQPVTLSFNSNLTIGSKPNLRYIRQMSSSDYIDLEQELFSRNFYNSQINSASRPVISPVVDLLNKARNGTITSAQAQQQIDQWRNIDAREDFEKYMYKPLVNQQYFLSAQGGSDMLSWSSAVGYDRNKDNLGATYQRINLRFQNTYRPIKQFSLTTGLLYTQSGSQSGRLGYTNVDMKTNSFVPYMQMADADGNALAVAKQYNQTYMNGLGGGNLLDWNYYPLIDWQHKTSKNSTSDILATAAVDYKVIGGLSAIVNYQYERQAGLGTDLADPESYAARVEINRFSQIVNGNVVYNVPKGSILDKSNSVLNANNLRGQLSFDRTYDKHSITAIAGAEIRSVNSDYHTERYYGYNPNNLTTGSVDYTRTYPTLPSGSGYIPRNQTLRETATRYTSQFANTAYTFDQRYVFSVSARRDASNLFGVNANDLWNPFWSTGLAWKLSNEKFYKVDFLPYINLRATYGLSGNIDPAMVAVNTITYSTNNSTFNGEPMAYFNNYYNSLLKWETSKMLNLAVDFRLKNNRLSGSVEYYHKKGENLFGAAPIDYTTGIPPTIIRNVASMRGNGWDLELKSLNIDRTFKWQTIFNYSIYKDKVTEYLIERTLARNYITTSSPPISGIKDMPVYAIFAYQWAGLDPVTGEARGYLNGEVSKNYTSITGVGTKVEDLEFFGSAIPTHFGSMNNNLSYKNLSLQLGISFKMGYWFRRNTINYTNLFNNWQGQHSDYALRWQKPGDELYTNVPVNQYTTNTNRDAFYTGSSVLVEKGDHIRLQYLNLAYDFKFLGKRSRGIKGLQVYVNANNLGLLWKANKADLDPDFNVGLVNLKSPANYSLGLRTNL